MESLTLPQAQAATAEETNVVVEAGPGSGKTRTLIERIIYLIETEGIVPGRIIVITFTNAAADEITRRLAAYFDGVESPAGTLKKLILGYCGTLHGFMLRLIKEHGTLIGFRKQIAMLSEEQQKKMRDDVVKAMKYKGSLKLVNTELENGPEKFLTKKPTGEKMFFNDVELVAAEYFQRLLSSGLLDFDSLLKFGAIVIDRLNAGGFVWPFDHLLWDEFQDSGVDDARIHRALTIANKFTVGDPDQSIYGFRGGDPSHLRSLAAAPGAKVILLQENFRCDRAITDAANRIIKNNPGDHVGTLSRTNGEGKLWTYRATGENEELRYLAEDINGQPDVNQCAVLVRTNALVDRIAQGLEGFGIAVAKKDRADRPADWLICRSLINLFANPDNDLLAYWWIEQQKDTKFANKIKLEALGAFTSINRHYLKIPNELKIDQVPAALGQSGISVESLELVNKAIAILNPGATMAELSFALGDDEIHRKEIGAGVTITTMHSSKGREWDCVYLPAFEEGVIPSISKSATIEEERRIAFVAITRARHRLCVSFANLRKPQFGGFKPVPAKQSPFLDELRRGE